MRKKVNRIKDNYRNGKCRDCGKEMIDWKRIDKRDINDVGYLFESLRLEYVRNKFWTEPIDDDTIQRTIAKGGEKIHEKVHKRLLKSVSLPSSQIFQDGRQTPLKGNIIYNAQYATATCCRKCIEEWHGINRQNQLSTEELRYLTSVIIEYLKQRIPKLFDLVDD
jgi:hypothetical protein